MHSFDVQRFLAIPTSRALCAVVVHIVDARRDNLGEGGATSGARRATAVLVELREPAVERPLVDVLQNGRGCIGIYDCDGLPRAILRTCDAIRSLDLLRCVSYDIPRRVGRVGTTGGAKTSGVLIRRRKLSPEVRERVRVP